MSAPSELRDQQTNLTGCAPSRGLLFFEWAGSVLLVLLVAGAYVPAYRAGYIWDDQGAVIGNALLRSPGGLWRIWFDPVSMPLDGHYYPLLHTAYWIEYQFWELNLAGFHAVNLALHAINALVLWFLLRRLAVPGAWLAAAVWALHPLQVESVAWIYEQKNTLSLLFYLLAVRAWVRFDSSRAWRWYALVIVLFAASLLCKTFCATLPIALLVLQWWRHGRVTRRDLIAMMPMAVLALAFGWFDSRLVAMRGGPVDYGLNAAQHVLLIGRCLWFYVEKLLWPTGLMAIYPKWDLSPSVPWQWLYPAAALIVSMVIWTTRRTWSRGPSAAAAHFALTLAPILGFVEYNYFGCSYVADHLVYQASPSIIALAVAGACVFCSAYRVPLPARVACSAVLVGVLATLSFQHARLFKDSKTLFSQNLQLNPDAFKAHLCIGYALESQGELQAAADHYAKAVRIEPRYARSHGALASALTRLGRRKEAMAEYRTALSLDAKDPFLHNDYANALTDDRDYSSATEQYRLALELRPDQPGVLYNMGTCLDDQGQTTEALASYRASLQLGGPAAQLHERIGAALIKLGQISEAIPVLSQALQTEPGLIDARYNIAKALEVTGNRSRAAEEYREVLRRKPDHVTAANNLAWILATAPEVSLRNGAQALPLAEQANAAAHGRNAAVLDTLAAAYAETGDFDRATSIAVSALDTATTQQTRLRIQLDQRLKMYKTRQPFRSPER